MAEVKRLRRAPRGAVLARAGAGMLVAAGLAGCPFHAQGLVAPIPGGTELETSEGDRYRLVTVGEAAPLAFLDGHTAEIDGTRVFRTVRVSDWKVTEGLHGLATWVGVLEQKGMQVGLQDRNSGAYYLVENESAAELEPYVGDVVLLEGWISGAHRVQVMYYRVLAEP